jgi:hypothetical protein
VNFFLLFMPIIVVLLLLLFWALRGASKNTQPSVELAYLEQSGRRNATYLRLIHQALSPADMQFLLARGSARLAGCAQKERRRVVLSYLAGLHDDFLRLLRLARAVAALSPEVAGSQEFERLRLSLQFSWRYQVLRASLAVGLLSLPRLDALSQMVSELAVRMEMAVKDLGERAILATKLASSVDPHGVDAA